MIFILLFKNVWTNPDALDNTLVFGLYVQSILFYITVSTPDAAVVRLQSMLSSSLGVAAASVRLALLFAFLLVLGPKPHQHSRLCCPHPAFIFTSPRLSPHLRCGVKGGQH